MAHGDKGKVFLGGSDGESPHGDKGKVFLRGSDGESPHGRQMKSLPWWKQGKSPPWWRQGKSSRKAGTQWEREKSSLVEAKGKVLQKTLRRYGGLSFRLSKSKRERQGKTDWRGKVAD